MPEAFVCGGYAGTGCLFVGGLVLFILVEVAMLAWQYLGIGTKHEDDRGKV